MSESELAANGFTTETQRGVAATKVRPRARRRPRARSVAASTRSGLCVRFVPPALSAAGLEEMRFVRRLLVL